MQTNNVTKIIIGVVVAIIILIIIGFSVASKDNDNFENVDRETSETPSQTSTSSVNSEIDTYINSSDDMPSQNDFNDSYEDLN